MSKLTNVKGRINYISSHARQENLYAVYETKDRKFWTELARCNQEEFIKSGTMGNCIEARELIVAPPESFVDYDSNRLLELFTNHFKQNYGIECIAALQVKASEEQIPDRPKKSALVAKYPRLEEIHEKLQQQNNAILQKEQKLGNLEIELDECKGMLKGKKRKELQEQMAQIKSQIEPMKRRLADIVKEYGYPNVKAFLLEYQIAKAEYADYKQAANNWDRQYGKGEKSMRINARLKLMSRK